MVIFLLSVSWMEIIFLQGSVYQKTNAMSEIRKTNKDTFWAQAEVRTRTHRDEDDSSSADAETV